MPGRLPISILVGLAACTWVLVLVVAGGEVDWWFARPFSFVVGVISVVLACFDRWVWRWPGLRAAVRRPDLGGTYWGVIRSEWVNHETGLKPTPISAAVVIRQTYTALTVTVFTADSFSSTIAAELSEEPDGRFSVAGLYRNEPRLSVQDGSRIHYGGLRLYLAGPDTRLHGSYWTDRDTKGEMEFTRVSAKRAADYVEARGLAIQWGAGLSACEALGSANRGRVQGGI
ncbi:MAG: hypothetical protein JNK49_14610 [Planctomycetes bacterium]|nr:hypothetical protein [Planctomycetota bacterium]